jgi:radical SAM protein with 4Fe4S-binding SPASM domain
MGRDSDRMKEQEENANRRVNLYERAPLATPFSLQFSPSGYCNFKCAYCWQSLSADVLARKFKKQFLDFELFKKAVDGCAGFGEPLKMILFAGLGEPLLHPHIDRMVSYARQSGVTQRVDLLTNASLLTREMSDRLIAAGLDRLRVSLQGLTTEKYTKICGSSIAFEKMRENIAYFYRRREKTSMYVKIIDCALDAHDEARFKEIFSPVSDDCAVEYVSPFVQEINYSKLREGFHGTFRDGGVPGGSRACPLPFYMIAVQADGGVTPWCTADIAARYGHIREKSIPEIWRSDSVRDFWRVQLTDRTQNPVCARCQVPSYNVRQGDGLNGHEREILERIRRASG